MHRSSSLSPAPSGAFRLACTAVLLLGFALTSVGCNSTKQSVGTATQVRFHEYRRGGKVMTIVNESHSDKVEFYSVERDDASTKVASDEIMGALIEQIGRVKFDKFARQGSAPTTSSEWSQAIEIQTPQGANHMIVRAGIPDDEAAAFRGTRDAFLAIYNNIYGAQAVKLKNGVTGFQRQSAGQ